MRFTKLSLCIVCLVALFYAIFKAQNILGQNFNCHGFIFGFEQLFSSTTKKEIKDFVLNNYKNKNYQELANLVLEKFNFIKSISISKRINGTIYIYFKAERPSKILNSLYYVSNNKKLFSFNDFVELELPQIRVSQGINHTEIIDFCANLNNEVLFDFDVSIESQNLIKLHSKKFPKLVLITSTKYQPKEPFLSICKDIFNENSNLKKNRCFDLRFKDQIILYEG